MAVTISRYNHTAKKLLNSEITLANLKFMLLDATYVFDATDTTLDEVAGVNTPPRANEVSGNGWTAGGEALASAAVTTVDTDGAMLDAADISVIATGGSIGPSPQGVITDGTSVFWHVDFGGTEEAGEGTDFKVTINASGIARVTDAA
jgi:hypothetical protein